MGGGRKSQEKSIANSRRDKSIANSRREKNTANNRRKGQEEAHRRPQVKESGEKLERRRAGASSIVTLDRRESCEEAAVLKSIQVVDSQSGEVVITVPTVVFNDARTRDPSCGTVGGEDETRPLRGHCDHGANGLIYVVDSNSQGSRADRGRRLLSFHRCNS